jgi:prolipoprotein diacylglyceryltransferase
MWSFTYPHNVNEAGVPIEGCVGRYCNVLPQAVYPTPFYETVMGLILFALLWSLRKKLRPYGALFALYLIVNGIERFLIEQIRVNNEMELFGLNPTQAEVIAIGLVLVGIALWAFLVQRRKVKPATA